ncbi:ribose-phosphate diphosphokinase [Mesoplasma lactucae]|uniref:Ribose-phosphate pyrophosphokinase n=1 Tax=Mesoplasma lactucae ATCC 49193 TaxID=81460 RepID=A0A291ISE4_9MOLU|nr:ribose-phosphate pyrophosphokinase [Mesoplasma lactucae]ATG97719.1 phosphoribosylpyrophosphate synthetase [Mesoplasma lactucae ATCC 49193]ATZ20506.1 ribose-phosphate pyrophosphokinase [Mesoplasma lactucae ATCC 49193]MCL8216677.1 Ribose-phosphate pyrophosphokinase [Mesoplasma lactucae ATCC 49193]
MDFNKGKNEEINIFGLSASQELTNEICNILGIEQKRAKTLKFADGEILVQSLDSVRGKEIYVVQSTNQPVNENLMELLIAIDAFKRASAAKINVVIPYYGYARQDRKAGSRQPITAKLVADLLTTAGANRVITVDIHSTQTMGFFDIPFDNFQTAQTISEAIIDTIIDNHLDYKNCILVSPDHGGLTRVHKVDEFTKGLTNGVAVIAKRRPEPNKAEVEFVLGDIEGKTCFVVDDMIDTGGTIINAAKALKDNGAKDVYIFACHGLFNGPAKQRMEDAIKSGVVKEIVVTNTIDIPQEKRFDGLKIISVANLIAPMIKASVHDESLSDVYDDAKDRIHEKVTEYIKKQK